MLELNEIRLCDREWIDESLKKSGFHTCEYSFANNFVWQKTYDIKCARFDGFYIVKCKRGFIFPAGDGNLIATIDAMKEYMRSRELPMRFISVGENELSRLKELYENEIKYEADRDNFDYIYNLSDLAELKGKKYHSKRNFVNRFEELDWTFEPMTEENIADCIKMNDVWCEENDCINNLSLTHECCAVREGMSNFTKLGLTGGLIRVNGEVTAFTYGTMLNDDTFDIMVEKALNVYAGAYPMINKRFAQYIGEKFPNVKYINREDDLGEENLRKAKLSYKPAIIEEKYVVEFV